MRMMLVMVAAIACGPSSSEIKTAKTATYKADPSEVFRIAQETAAQTYKIAEARPEQLAFMTEMQWYNEEGGRESAGAGDYVQINDKSVQLGLIVEVVQGNEVRVVVTPKTFQHLSGSPKPRELAPTDPNLPGWVTGRAEQLQLEIHKALEKYAVKK